LHRWNAGAILLLQIESSVEVTVVEQQIVNPWTWQEQFGFVQANAVTGAERTVYCSGQTSMDSEGRPLHEGDMRAQVTQALDNLEAVLRESGCDLSDVVRLNYYTTDVGAFFETMDAVVARLNKAGCRPASTLLQVSGLALPPLLVELEATAVAGAGEA
jgi:enamine deaminase RidA (YjgF/YER057c/UK114 family)